MLTPSTSPVRDYISSTIIQIKEGLPKDAQIAGDIKFEISTVAQSGKGGQLDIGILNLGGEASAQATQKVSFAVKFPSAAEEAEEAARKAESDYRRTERELARQSLGEPATGFTTGGRSNYNDE